MSDERKFYGWNLVGVLWFIYLLNMGFVLYGGVVIHTYMMKEIVMDRATYGLAFTLVNFFTGVPAVLVGTSVVKYGVRWTMLFGSALLVIGTVWMALVTSAPWHYVVGFGAILGLGMGFSTIVPLTTVLSRWFVRMRGRAIGIAMTASGFAGFIASPLMNKIMVSNDGDWRQGWLIILGLVIFGAIITFIFVKERPEDMGQVPDGKIIDSTVSPSVDGPLITKYSWTPSEAYRTLAFWLVFIAAIAEGYPFYFFTAHWIPHLRGLGISAADAALAMGMFTMGGIAGRIIGGWLMDKIAARYAFATGLCGYIIGSILAMQVTPNNLILGYIAAICYGAAFGWTFVCQNTVVANFFGAKNYPKINGTLFSGSVLVGCCSGLIGGKVFDIFKSYNPAFYIIMTIVVIGIIAIIFAKMPVAPSVRSSENGSKIAG
ncbi:MFS transporter [Sporomusa acidovorans]|uniref:L-lactate transporter n=1 Tax=Sporomusa acidovorans (strain ATCC 49682 / DSM 3132 / Mol) TaxID=1123286 RepID=A0ABZ3JAS3_SPOA4|nr:MFS transporter [Sporomusa acidovorans]OZC16982.1 putative MFS-type transporter YhjX [Sporomusa acidovorans DSM 3132]SDF33258.1 Major Facilitator Superfamily protein [Sporomusa acidovorans]